MIEYSTRGSIAVLAFGSPPVNSLNFAVRCEITSALDRAQADPAVTAVVLAGQRDTFSAGADIREFGTPDATRAPNLRHLIAALESSRKPVIAAIAGACLGGGLELALGCHYRVVAKTATLGLPEVKLGLLPGAGGTQRLPRLIGVEAAINMIVSGEPALAAQLAGTPLIDQLVDGDVLAAAIELAGTLLRTGARFARVRDRQIHQPNLEALCQFARQMVRAASPRYPAPLKCIDAVAAAATQPFEEGLNLERRLFAELLASPESLALRHAFLAERAASRVPDVPADTPVRPVRSAAVVGAGTMGAGITVCFLNAGIPVRLLELSEEALAHGIERVRETYDAAVRKGKLTPAQRHARMALLTPARDYRELGEADIVIEAVFEEFSVKEQVFRSLARVVKAGAILATNTSTLDVDRIAACTQRPQDVIGAHFFSPAHVMKLLEVVRGRETARDVLATTMKLAKGLKKTAVVSRVCDGFIGNRMIEQYFRQALFMLEEGSSPEQIDAAVERFGFAMGPFRVSDLAGNDIGWSTRKRRYVERPEITYSPLADQLCELGRYGQKTGAGWYDYRPKDRSAYPSPVVAELIAKRRALIGIEPRRIEAKEITDRLVFALVNEGAKILEEGIAQRASDIDVVYLTGYGFPLWRGGPMFYADQLGLYEVVRRMRELGASEHGDPGFWRPAERLARLAARGESFNEAVGIAL